MSILHIAFYPSDWMAGTRGMSDAETGVYITLVARMYEMAGPIERDDNRLSRLCGCKSKSAFVRSLEYLISEGKIQEADGQLFNERVEKEIKNTTEKSEKAKAAAQSRWSKKTNKNKARVDADASPKHMPEPCQLELEPEEVDKSTSQEAVFYQRYLKAHPKPVESSFGEERFHALIVAGRDPEQIIGAAEMYAETVKAWSPEAKVQQSDNFLCEDRGKWLNYIPPAKATDAEVLDFYAEIVRKKAPTARITVNRAMAARLVAASLVTPDQLKAAGVDQ